MTAILEARRVVVARGRRRLLDDVTLDVRAGEVLVVMGANGAGKSTLVRVLAGDGAVDAGDVLLDGRPLATWSALEQAKRRAVLSQDHVLDFAFTAFEVVLLGRSPHCAGNPGARDRESAWRALEKADASHLADRLYPTLSGGERARVMLARVIAQVDVSDGRVRALILDEPSASLDIAHQHAAFGVARSLAHDEGLAVVAVLHDPNLAALYADRIAILKDGRLIVCGSVDEALTEEHMRDGFDIDVVRLRHPTLDAPLLVPATTWRPASR